MPTSVEPTASHETRHADHRETDAFRRDARAVRALARSILIGGARIASSAARTRSARRASTCCASRSTRTWPAPTSAGARGRRQPLLARIRPPDDAAELPGLFPPARRPRAGDAVARRARDHSPGLGAMRSGTSSPVRSPASPLVRRALIESGEEKLELSERECSAR